MDPTEQQQAALQLEQQKRVIMLRILSKEAYERLARIKLVNPELAGQLELYIMQLVQAGRLTDMVTDQKLKEILKILSSPVRKTSIKRR
ncbi:MAG: hypothetical protein KKA90_03715 [Nanoarchaeota archaeon]|nr:hypothetical protein [Nanoarchaeota archaeon]